VTDPAAGAIDQGRAVADLSSWWKVAVGGADAHTWLNDLLSGELDGIASGESRRSFLLTPTGRIQASVTALSFEGGYLLLQDSLQPARIDTLLDRYVLSSDVRLRDRSEELRLLAFPGGGAPRAEGSFVASPSVLGEGEDLLVPSGVSPQLGEAVALNDRDVERWRIRRGFARFGVDLTTESLPHEVELRGAVAYGKGCFLGQEAVARVRNLGHPPFVLLAVDADAPVHRGEQIRSGERDAGSVTSASQEDGAATAIARIRWALKDAPIRTASGVELRSRGLASAA
jgi:folate-binding protein YgfZ